MTNPASALLAADMLQLKEPYSLDLLISLSSGTPSVSSNMLGYPVLLGVAAISQATVDAFLGSTNEIVATTAFGSTAMGTDAIAFIINMQGGAKSALWAASTLFDTTRLFNCVEGQGTSTTVLPNTLTQGFSVTSAGNIYGRLVISGLDSSSNLLKIQLGLYLK